MADEVTRLNGRRFGLAQTDGIDKRSQSNQHTLAAVTATQQQKLEQQQQAQKRPPKKD